MWSPEQYLRFEKERAQPFFDLLSLVEPRPQMRVVDLGCGTGALTRELHEKLGANETTGIDRSAEMLAKARSLASDSLNFEQGDIATFAAADVDLVFSNAALHWIADHERLFRRLIGFLRPGGQLAVQMPWNDDHPSHRIARETAAAFGLTPQRAELLSPENYASLLHESGMARQHVRVQVYGHLLPRASGVVEWVKGSTLTEYREPLGPVRYEEFLVEYSRRLLAEIGDGAPYFYTFKRVLIWGSLSNARTSQPGGAARSR